MVEQSDYAQLAALVQKYDRPGPRYTSYPTAPEWSDQYGPEQYAYALKQASELPKEPLSFYLHIPYCKRRCWFCGCNTMVSRTQDKADEYLGRVERELDMVSAAVGNRKLVSQLHWGGGTPSFLTDTQTTRAFDVMASRFQIAPDAEISIELDPRVTTLERISLLKTLGFNRLSFGVQDFDSDVQAAIGRNQTEAETVHLYHHCRAEGFTGINFDLIYGLPQQTILRFIDTIKKVIDLRPDRIAMYSFAYLPEGKGHQLKLEKAALPSPQVKFDLFHTARRMFTGNGYIQIGMDHFVLPTDELAIAAQSGKLRRNFMGYTVVAARDWIGIGMSSISYISNAFAQNHSGLGAYNEAIDNGRLPTYRGLALSTDDLIRQFVISELMCNFRLDLAEINRQFGTDAEPYFADELAQLSPFISDGLISRDGAILSVTPLGRIFVRNIAMTFDGYLKPERKKKTGVQFSRTI